MVEGLLASETRLTPQPSQNQIPHWATGDQIVYREVWKNRVWTARPVTVVQDTPELIVLYLSAGTRWKMPAPLDEGVNIYHHYLLKENWRKLSHNFSINPLRRSSPRNHPPKTPPEQAKPHL